MINNIVKKIKKMAFVGGVLGIFLAPQILLNELVYNAEYVSENYHSISKPDGLFMNHTDFRKFQSGNYMSDEVYQSRFLTPSRVITDGGMWGEYDGLVDRIYIRGPRIGGVTGVLTRKTNYEKHKDEFDNADKILIETKKRFEKYF